MDCKAAGATPAELIAARYAIPADLGGAPTTSMSTWPDARDLRLKGDGPRKLKKAGYSALELHAAGYKTDELTRLFPLKELKECDDYGVRAAMLTGASARDVLRANFGADAWQATNFDHDMFRRSGLNVGFCIGIGLSGKEIRATGFSVSDWRDAGLVHFKSEKPFDLFDEPVYRVGVAGASRRPIIDTTMHQANKDDVLATSVCVSQKFKDVKTGVMVTVDFYCLANGRGWLTSGMPTNPGKEAKDLNMEFSIATRLGYDCLTVRGAGYTLDEIKAAKFAASDCRGAEFTISELKGAGYTAKQTKAAGFNIRDHKAAGFSAIDVLKADFDLRHVRSADYSVHEVKDAGGKGPSNRASRRPRALTLCVPAQVTGLMSSAMPATLPPKCATPGSHCGSSERTANTTARR